MKQWVLSDELVEIWPGPEYEKREDAIAAGHRIYDHDFYVGKAVPFVPMVDADAVIERIQMDAFDEVGEIAEGWIDYAYDSPEVESLQRLLQKAFDDWLEETGSTPGFFRVEETESIEFCEELNE